MVLGFHPHLASQQFLHQAALLGAEGVEVLAVEGEFEIDGVEYRCNGILLLSVWDPDRQLSEFFETQTATAIHRSAGIDLIEVEKEWAFQHAEEVVGGDCFVGFENGVDRADESRVTEVLVAD